MLRIISLERSSEWDGMFDNNTDAYARKRYRWGTLRGFCVGLSRRFARLSCSTCTDGASGKAVFPGPSDRSLYLLSNDCRVFRRLLFSAAFGPTRPAFHGCCVGINRWTGSEGRCSEQRRDTYIVQWKDLARPACLGVRFPWGMVRDPLIMLAHESLMSET